MVRAVVTPKLPLPHRVDSWRRVAAPRGVTIELAKKNEVVFTTEDGNAAERLKQLAGRLAMQTDGVFVFDGQKLKAKVDAPLAKFYRAIARADSAKDAAGVKRALATLRSKLGPKADSKGFVPVIDAKLKKLAREDDPEIEPKVRFGKPATDAQLAKVDKAFTKKFGRMMPDGLRAFLVECDGLGGNWFRSFGSVKDVLAGIEEDWSAVSMRDDGEGPGLLPLGVGALVVDIWHETPGNEYGEGWPVLGVNFGEWLSSYLASGMNSIAESPWSEVSTPVLLDWSDKSIEIFWKRHERGGFTKNVASPDWRMQAYNAMEAGRFEEAALAATKLAQSTPRDWARGTFLRAKAFQKLGRAGDAKKSLDELVTRYLDDRPVAPPGMHPRAAIDAAELSDLVIEVLGAKAKEMIRKITEAKPLEAEGDFL